jgi:hypothetical protein
LPSQSRLVFVDGTPRAEQSGARLYAPSPNRRLAAVVTGLDPKGHLADRGRIALSGLGPRQCLRLALSADTGTARLRLGNAAQTKTVALGRAESISLNFVADRPRTIPFATLGPRKLRAVPSWTRCTET